MIRIGIEVSRYEVWNGNKWRTIVDVCEENDAIKIIKRVDDYDGIKLDTCRKRITKIVDALWVNKKSARNLNDDVKIVNVVEIGNNKVWKNWARKYKCLRIKKQRRRVWLY